MFEIVHHLPVNSLGNQSKMKIYTAFLVLVGAACAVADLYPSSEYLPPENDIELPSNEYLAPLAPAAPITQHSSGVLADDGYRYKVVRRYKTAKRYRSRHRRDVNELPSNEYLPPLHEAGPSHPAPSNEYLAPIAPAAPNVQHSSGVLADDGYRYKTVKRYRTAKRFRSRHRRDVSELPSNEYLPPFQQHNSVSQELQVPKVSSVPSNEYLAPIAPSAQHSSGVLADDGYRYKTVKRYRTAKRFRSRHRRDVDEIDN